MTKKLFLFLHGLVFLLGAIACVILFNARGGHPPGIIFLPFAGAAWVFLHIFFGVMQKLGTMGRRRAIEYGQQPEPWPPALILVVLGCCFIFFNGLSALAPLIMYRRETPILLAVFVAVQGLNLACLCGIMLRRDWARMIAGGALLLIAVIILIRVAPVLLWGSGIGLISLAYLACVIAGFSGLGYYLLTSDRIRNFFVK